MGILALRFVRPERRNLLAGSGSWCSAPSASGSRSGACSRWTRSSATRGPTRWSSCVVTQLGLSPAQARSQVLATLGTNGIDVQAQFALWLTLAGRRARGRGRVRGPGVGATKRVAGDAIDPDTLTASARRDEPERRAPDV